MIDSPQNGTTDFIVTLPNLPNNSITIGKIGVWQDSEIGFILSRTYWGQGLAQEALSAILHYLFDEKGMQEITADVDPRNERSVRVLQGMGFVKTRFVEKTFEIGGEWVDSLYLGLKKEVWEGRYKERR
ncbi:hypothetical protein H2200_005884 [Cladophialophora chaetospira]|uniref:N-acetyltransferase domain-containing protein n=1 Tax=Cladophialophora chaetospira TaxID=386627 RepID=A0AA38X9W4_9EURO|nr:hypothetical protein H2200_005884 [Cladophialophora chaetospira]